VASAATVICLLLLTLKDFLHRLARRVELADATMKENSAVTSVVIPSSPRAAAVAYYTTQLARALNLMEARKITALLVVDAQGAVEGVLHLHDLWETEMI